MAVQRGVKWQANVYTDGKRVRPTFNTKEEAEFFERNPMQAKRVALTVDELFKHGYSYLWEGTKNAKEQYYITEELITRLGASMLVSTITPAVIQDLVMTLRATGNSGARINRKLSALRMLLTHCYNREAITAVPAFPKKQPESQGRERFLTEQEVGSLLARIDSSYEYDFALFLLHTGARVGEALALRWEDVGEDRVTFRWDTTKSGKTRAVGLNAPAREAIKAAGNNVDGPWSGIDYNRFRRSFDKAKQSAGLANDPEVVPHILRHTHASWLVQRGVPIQVVSKLLGHSSITITMRYAKLAPDSLLDVTKVLTE